MSEFGKAGVAVRNIARADAAAVERLGRAMAKNSYGQYLLRLLRETTY